MKNQVMSLMIFLLSISSSNSLFSALKVVPGGQNIAFEVYPSGIIVTGSYNVKTSKNTYNPSKDSDINKGDLIVEIGEYQVTDLKSFTSKLHYFINDGYCNITLKRENKYYQRKLMLIDIDSSIKTGLYVKERLLGIGTVTYYNPDNNTYGALGHEIYDDTTESILEVRKGSIYFEDVDEIVKSDKNDIGSKKSDITLDDEDGTIFLNTTCGIYGKIEEIPSSYQAIETAKISEIKLGKAYLRTCINGNLIQDYLVNITSLNKDKNQLTKGISFQIDDKELLNKTGGIIQGMSGSPLIQDNKLIGAVSHVVKSDPSKGYGIYIENMLSITFEENIKRS